MSFALQKLWSFMRSHLSILDLTAQAIAVLFRNFSPVPISSRLFTTFSSISFSVSKLIQPLWKSVWRFLRKLNTQLPDYPSKPLLGIYPEDVPTGKKDTCSTMCRVRSWPARTTRPPVLLTAVYSVLILLVYISLVYISPEPWAPHSFILSVPIHAQQATPPHQACSFS